MPFVLISGYPCSGKTTFANQLVKYINENYPETPVELINEESLGILRQEAYKTMQTEDRMRTALKGQVLRFLNRETIVILDSLNYNKSFRYELKCHCKSIASTSVTISVTAPKEKCIEWNAQREEKYSDEMVVELIERYEVPLPSHKWDQPLFNIQPGEELPCKQICEILFNKFTGRINFSVKQDTVESSTTVTQIDAVTQDIIGVVMKVVNSPTFVGGDPIVVPQSNTRVVLPRKVSVAEINRVRRSFLKLIQQNLITLDNNGGDAFVAFLNSAFL
ncbi:toxin resistance protein, putative [Entamoeba histolytica HM-1:IMSS-B]|uniref:Toxin resistance protein, putative n=8 Tax=Entamoeba TaxID=5758 RepID=C4LTP3_ENTH1|nr:toxin resistance protein, putative [Entamoeba nuttalli P19]XP_655321.1 toxin resistance protein, putative [Entamoeba histolytica HM-1:IMSS]EMD44231.1 toxin resistance protein, putative [Entamoeba histolytica KU27]EMH72067.1 toxin resistance protein, putative [Entamoeba histolytica HM-1:IMSS-B]EMS16010.1 toxin resistance protein, putative [Entamoeba histolytica HM-3:IMSS]ENY65896.1 toxin resistance protein, putative [Entamoeba histolytica HM-1:IMSS-A]GAT91945.1 toxin resistance protein puta|eukprot:XP_008857160.1 toxin resistance protein, putative [Entamoeba nuttalli P19]